MRPRVFVSSTYYDLRYIRDNLELFVEQYGFEPVLFESGNITFEHEKPLDESCYEEVKLCHMMILIIGGRYGSPASDKSQEEHITKYEEEYMSITRKEFRTAKEKGIPIFVFIDKNVDSEYQTFKKNENIFLEILKNNAQKKSGDEKFKFAHADSHYVFNFISEVRVGAVCTFENFEDIEGYLRNQWAGMFYTYLDELRSKKDRVEILDSVNEIKLATERMNDILKAVGLKVFDKDEDKQEFEQIILTQNRKLVIFFASRTFAKIKFKEIQWSDREAEIARILYDDYLENQQLKERYTQGKVHWKTHSNIMSNVKSLLNTKIKALTEKVEIEEIDYHDVIPIYYQEIKPLLVDNVTLKAALIEEFRNELDKNGLPF